MKISQIHNLHKEKQLLEEQRCKLERERRRLQADQAALYSTCTSTWADTDDPIHPASMVHAEQQTDECGAELDKLVKAQGGVSTKDTGYCYNSR